MGLHGVDQGAGAGRQPDTGLVDGFEGGFRQTLQESDPGAQRWLEGERPAHGLFGDGRNLRLEPNRIGELVNAFALNDGRIHVGNEEALATPRAGQRIDVDSGIGESAAHGIGIMGGRFTAGEREIDGAFRIQSVRGPRLGARLTQSFPRPRHDGGRYAAQRRIADQGENGLHAASMIERHASPERPRALLIAGPTASGKSALALALAERLNGMVINADALQVYRELAVLTARPSPEARARVPHRLYGTVSATTFYSVARWLADVQGVLAEAEAQGRLPIFVGGTGLYFSALTEGLAAIPPIPARVRAEVRARLTGAGAAALHGELARVDPAAAARIEVGDRQRIARAFEVWAATGRPISAWQEEARVPLLPLAQTVPVVLNPPRPWLYGQIDERFAAMLSAGALLEVESLLALKLPPEAPALKALGVAPLADVLAGATTIDEAVARAQRASRNYAKRQLTWFKGKMMSWSFVNEQYSERLLDEIFSLLPHDR